MNDISRILAEYASGYAPLITADEAAQIAHRKVQTIYEWSCQGRLDSCRARQAGRLLLRRDAFVRFLLGHEEPAALAVGTGIGRRPLAKHAVPRAPPTIPARSKNTEPPN